jgi:hypothetical protein
MLGLSTIVVKLIPVIKTIHLTHVRMVEDNRGVCRWGNLSLGGYEGRIDVVGSAAP